MTVRNKSLIIRTLVAVVILAALVTYIILGQGPSDFKEKYEGVNLSVTESGRKNTYTKYLQNHADAETPDGEISVDVFTYTNDQGVSVINDLSGVDKALRSEEESTVDFSVNVPKAGFYNIEVQYYPLEGRGIDIERTLYINGEVPFLGAEDLIFNRVWADAASGVRQDNQGNDIRPTQVEKPIWQTVLVTDNAGYISEPYKFYFEAGESTLTLKGISEPFAVKAITLKAIKQNPTYAEYLKNIDTSKYQNNDKTFLKKVQGENADYRSSPSLYATFDRSSGTTEPYSVATTKLNIIGGQAWRVAGQWIEWDFEVPENGMYAFSVKARQNYNRGMVSNRSIYIDNQILCEETAVIPFRYTNKWELLTISDEEGDYLYFPLEKGNHTFKMKITLGDLSQILTDMEESIFRLNAINLQILVLTGADPDVQRDYRIEEYYPNIMEEMAFESKVLYNLVDRLVEYSGEKGAEAASLQTLAKQLEKFVEKPQDIPKTLQNFKDNISAMGNSLVGLASSQLDIDYFVVSAPEAKLPDVNESFITSLVHEVKSFVASFFVDYNKIGNVYASKEAIEVWMLSGRDQSTILKTMIDDDYTPKSDNPVNVKLVAVEALMPAVVAGTGPDVALTVMNNEPINYALRKASIDLSQFDGFTEVIKEFQPSTLIPFEYNGGYYGLPETLNFNVMFYRKDILEDLGVEVPNTWDDLIKIIPIIQKQNMNVGIPSVERKINNMINPDLSNFFCHLYQNSGALYSEDGSKTLLDDEVAVRAFENYTKLFTHYKAPTLYDFVNRFRTGEMPLGFVDYNNFNTLVVFAPEIRGLWDFTILPGTVMEDGTINRSVSAWGNACMMLASTKNPNSAWEFISWWVNSSTQVRFGRELEALMGAAARYATANVVAFDQLSWNSANSKVLKEQWEWVVGTPEVPGGYYTGRHIVNAVRKVINKNEDTRETLLDYTRTINEELTKKRKEFGITN